MVRYKLVTVGDPGVGKTCLLYSFTHGEFLEKYVPTVIDNCVGNVVVDGVTSELFMWDTTGEEGYDYLRPLAYPATDVILLAFAIDNPATLLNLQEYWLPELKHYLPHVPIVMVGLKSDLREDPATVTRLADFNMRPVSQNIARRISSSINAFDYVECSAKTRQGVTDVFAAAVRAVLDAHTVRRRRFCSIL